VSFTPDEEDGGERREGHAIEGHDARVDAPERRLVQAFLRSNSA
jgi:hypothetical protein